MSITKHLKLLIALAFLSLLLAACSQSIIKTTTGFMATVLQEAQIVKEHKVTNIRLAGVLAQRNSEISGLAWYKDYLILLPQYPSFGRSGSFLHAIPKTEIESYLDGQIDTALETIKIQFEAGNLAQQIDGYEGYEAIAFKDNNIYLTIEANTQNGMRSYLVSGEIKEDLSEIIINTDKVTEIVPPVNLRNQSDEAIFIVDNKVVTIFEANGKEVNNKPLAHEFSLELEKGNAISFPEIEYRITDSTSLDLNNRFWAINYFYPGDKDLYSDNDPIANKYGLGKSHQQYEQVERLIELEYRDNIISLIDTKPIQLELSGDVARNWEGIVRFGELGFLIVSDKYPETILGYVENK